MTSARALPLGVAIVAIALGAWLRARGLGDLFLYGDELHSLPLSTRAYVHIWSSYEPLGSGIGLPLLQRLARDLLGADLWALRLPNLLGGIGGLVAVFLLGRRLVGEPAAALATAALALNPLHAYHSHFARGYTLATLCCIVFAHALVRLAEPGRPSHRWSLVAMAAGGLAPFLQAAASASVVALGVGALLMASIRGRLRAAGPRLAGALLGGALLAAALHLPAAAPLADFVANKAANRADSFGFDPFDVATVFAGSAAFATVGGLLTVVSLAWLARRRPGVAVLLGCGALGPALALAAAAPAGGVYAYARYLLPALPFALLTLSAGICDAAEHLLGHRSRAGAAALAAGLALVVAAYVASPLGRAGVRFDPFANLPAATLIPELEPEPPLPATPGFYATLAASPTPLHVVEAPAVFASRLALYRNYFVQHGHRVSLGTLGGSPADLVSGPYVPLRVAPLKASGADVLVLHRDLEAEQPRSKGRASPPRRPLPAPLVARLHRELGEPVAEDRDVVVWRLR